MGSGSLNFDGLFKNTFYKIYRCSIETFINALLGNFNFRTQLKLNGQLIQA